MKEKVLNYKRRDGHGLKQKKTSSIKAQIIITILRENLVGEMNRRIEKNRGERKIRKKKEEQVKVRINTCKQEERDSRLPSLLILSCISP